MPSGYGLPSTLDSMASSECSEVVSSGVWLVLKEDCMLGFAAELLHLVREIGVGE